MTSTYNESRWEGQSFNPHAWLDWYKKMFDRIEANNEVDLSCCPCGADSIKQCITCTVDWLPCNGRLYLAMKEKILKEEYDFLKGREETPC